MDLTTVIVAKGSESSLEKVIKNALSISDEVVVVVTEPNTGTQMATMRLAAKVVNCPMPEFDYSTPRNIGINCARGSYVFQLDTDEMVNECFGARLRKLCSDRKFDSFTFLQHTYDNIDRRNDQRRYQIRLTRKDGPRFDGLTYQSVWPQKVFGVAEIIIEHFPPISGNKEKDKHRSYLLNKEYTQILNEGWKDDIDWIVGRIVRCRMLYHYGIKRNDLIVLSEQAYQRGLRMDCGNEFLAIETSTSHRLLEKHEKAHDVLGQVRKGNRSHRYWDELAAVQEKLGQMDQALLSLEESTLLYPNSVNWKMKAHIHLKKGEEKTAIDCLHKAKQFLPEDRTVHSLINSLKRRGQ